METHTTPSDIAELLMSVNGGELVTASQAAALAPRTERYSRWAPRMAAWIADGTLELDDLHGEWSTWDDEEGHTVYHDTLADAVDRLNERIGR